MSTVSEKLLQVAENVPKVYHAGQMNVVENAECLKGTKSDTAMLLDDVSPVTHEMGVKVRKINLFDVSKIQSINGITNNGDGTLTLVGGRYAFNTGVKLSDLCPDLKVGDTVFLSATTTGVNVLSFGSSPIWAFNTSFKVTENAFKDELYLYGKNSNASDYNEPHTISNIQIEYGEKATTYTPYVPDLTAVKVSRCGKNLLSYPYVETTLTRNGITFTDNGDGTITANGTATADTQFRLQDTVVYPDNYNPFKYLIGKTVGINGSPDGSSKDTYAIQSIQTGQYGNMGFTISNSNRYRFAIFIKSGITVSNLVFKPMIYLRGVTNYDYEFYNRTDYTPTADGTVNGVTSLYPNTTLMTDTNGIIIDCDYYKDIDKAYNKLSAAIALSGGE